MDAAPVIYQMVDELEQKHQTSISDGWLKRYSDEILWESWDGYPENNLPKKQTVRKFNFSRWAAYNAYIKYYGDCHIN